MRQNELEQYFELLNLIISISFIDDIIYYNFYLILIEYYNNKEMIEIIKKVEEKEETKELISKSKSKEGKITKKIISVINNEEEDIK